MNIEPGGGSPRTSSRPIRLCGSMLGARAHICAFLSSPDEQYGTLLLFIKDGLACSEKVVHTVDPGRRDEHLTRLASAGIDVIAARQLGECGLRSQPGQYDL